MCELVDWKCKVVNWFHEKISWFEKFEFWRFWPPIVLSISTRDYIGRAYIISDLDGLSWRSVKSLKTASALHYVPGFRLAGTRHSLRSSILGPKILIVSLTRPKYLIYIRWRNDFHAWKFQLIFGCEPNLFVFTKKIVGLYNAFVSCICKELSLLR